MIVLDLKSPLCYFTLASATHALKTLFKIVEDRILKWLNFDVCVV